jgi:TolA-binding protein
MMRSSHLKAFQIGAFFICLYLFGQISPVAAQTTSREADRQLSFAFQMLNNNMAVSAVNSFRAFIENYPSHPQIAEARFGLAQSLEISGDSEAIAAFRSYLRLHSSGSRIPEARYGLAKALYDAGDWSGALAGFTEFTARHAGHARGLTARYYEGLCLVKTRRPLEAIPIFRSVADSATMPLKAEAAFSAAAALWQANRPAEEAAEALTAVTRAWPGTEASAKAEGLLGDILYRNGRFAEAARRYHQAIQFGLPYADELSFWKAWSLARSGDTRAGAVELDILAAKYPRSRRATEALRQAADLHLRVGDTTSAVASLAHLASFDLAPEAAAEARYQSGRILFEAGRRAEARIELLEVIRLDAGYLAEAEYLLAVIELTEGNRDRVESWLMAAERRNPEPALAGRILAARLDLLRAANDPAGIAALIRRLESSRSPLLPTAILLGGEIEEEAGRNDNAIREYARVASRFPASTEAATALYRAGLIHYQSARYPEAETHFARFLTVEARERRLDGDAWYWIGFARYQVNRMAPALEAFLRVGAMADHPLRAQALFRAGNTAFNLRRFDEALRHYDEVAALRGIDERTLKDARYNRAEALKELGRVEEARAAYLAVFADGGIEYEQALLNAATLLEEMERFEEAAAAYEEAVARLETSGRKEEALLKAGALRMKLGRLDEAEAHFSSAADLDGAGAPDAILRLGEIRLARGETEGALIAFRRAAAQYPTTLFGRRALLKSALLMPSGETATALLESLIRSIPDDPVSASAQLHLGLEAEEAGRRDSAIQKLRAALETLPDGDDLARARLALGRLHLAANQLPQARTQLEFLYRSPLYQNHPLRPRAGLLLVETLLKMNRRAEARKVLEETVDKYSELLNTEEVGGLMGRTGIERTNER